MKLLENQVGAITSQSLKSQRVKKKDIYGQKKRNHSYTPAGRLGISTVDAYNAMMIRLHYVNYPNQATADAEVDRTLWLTTDVAKRLISILEVKPV